MNSTERVERNRRIAEEHSRGVPWAAVAQHHGVSERQARRAAREAREALAGAEVGAEVSDALVIDPAALLARVVAIHDRALDRLERLADAADNDSARLGAARSAPAVAASLLNVLARAALLPDAPSTWRNVRDMRLVAEALERVADRRGLDLGEVIEEFECVQAGAVA